jgi:hypothetical protein
MPRYQDDADLVLLDDGEIGYQDRRDLPSIRGRTVR